MKALNAVNFPAYKCMHTLYESKYRTMSNGNAGVNVMRYNAPITNWRTRSTPTYLSRPTRSAEPIISHQDLFISDLILTSESPLVLLDALKFNALPSMRQCQHCRFLHNFSSQLFRSPSYSSSALFKVRNLSWSAVDSSVRRVETDWGNDDDDDDNR